MKFIKNGKIFGALNILDILIIVVILVIVLPSVHYYIKFNEKGFAEQKLLERYLSQNKRIVEAWSDREGGTVDVVVSLKDLSEEDIANIKVGDKETLPDGTVMAEIVSIGEPEKNYRYITNLREGETDYRRITLDDNLYSLPAVLRLRGFVREGVFYYKATAVKDLSRWPFTSSEYVKEYIVEPWPYNR